MHNAAAGMRAEILAGREIPHATVIAFSQGKGGAGSHKDDDNVRDPGSIYRPIVEISFAFSPLFAQFRTNRRLYARIDTALRVIACYQKHGRGIEMIYRLMKLCVSCFSVFLIYR